MNHPTFDENADNGRPANEGANGAGAASAGGDNPAGEIARLRADCARMNQHIKELEKERDSYLKALYHYMTKEFTREDIEASATMEEGVPFEVILQDMEQILNEPKSVESR